VDLFGSAGVNMLRTKLLLLGLLTFGVSGIGVAAASSITSAPQQAVAASRSGEDTAIVVTLETIRVMTGTPTSTPTSTLPLTLTWPLTDAHKVVVAISSYFSVPVSNVVQLHDSGWGFGEIYKLYEYARLSGHTPEQIQAMRDAGMGWGNIAKALNIKPGNHGDNLGGIMSGRSITLTDSLTSTTTLKRNRGNRDNDNDSTKPERHVPAKIDKNHSSQSHTNNGRGSGNGTGNSNGNQGGHGNGNAGGKPSKKP
jgi:hypothetical protein